MPTLKSRIIVRNDTLANFTSVNPVLLKGEMGVAWDGTKPTLKVGDGTTAWNSLPVAGGVDVPTTVVSSGTAAGAVAGTLTKNAGGTSYTGTMQLANSGITAGTYTKITANAQGIITGVAQMSSADVPVDAALVTRLVALGVVKLAADGKLDPSILPPLAISETFVVANKAALLTLTAQRGDIGVVTATADKGSYILTTDDPTVAANWVLLITSDDQVISVNGKTGAVTLSTSDISEGTNLYFTNARAIAAIEGAADRWILDGGAATLT